MGCCEVFHPDFRGYILAGTRLHRLAGGFRFLEGPVWDAANQRLIFSDIPGNALYVHSREHRALLYRANSYMANGNCLDHQGNLLTCEHATSRVTRTAADGSYSVLAETFQGRHLNSPNDIIVKRDGMVYFTDPASGRGPVFGVPRPQDLDFQGVYRLNPDTGHLDLLLDDCILPNGLCFSRDETYLYINDTARQHIRRFRVTAEGLLTDGVLFAELLQDHPIGKADGMKIDSSGLLYCTGPGGIQVFNGEGVLVGRIPVPEQAANFTWGGADLQTLFITASTALYSIRVEIPGCPSPT